MRLLVSLVLALTVALSSVTMAQARHHARAADLVQLCTGVGMIVIAVDAKGNPVGPTLPCPECTPALAALPGTDRAVIGLAERLVPLAFAAADRAHPPHPAARHRYARAPPVPV
jgi:hypothetical protein